ncbi:hypothetical protein ACFOZ0_34770 [Streptomyces yaanensis]|uniref:Uncharacterized protein n=1 Tax=Streptomyces yaanensis TaxID=1142239 RepID=A0ABV7SSR8_9ACTN|nr:hypothetical protein [Streptomyces sp. CGMCC 4.7035]WNB97289.1 hypothetical protein Q2K21_03935 [Streptomyces sp. CGMCC 4.7035]
MLRHEFQPGRLIAGAALTVAGVLFLGDAGGAWETPWYVIVPIVNGGLCLAAVTGLLARAIRRGRTSRGELRAERGEATAP